MVGTSIVPSDFTFHANHGFGLFRNQNTVSKSGSEASSDEENDASEYTVYECPGLATVSEWSYLILSVLILSV